MNKVAPITVVFWVLKICATTLGETAGDLVSMTLNVGYAVSSILLLSLFFISLIAQLRAVKFHPTLFWTVILTTSTAGTTMSDFMDRTLGLGYAKGSLLLVTLLITVLTVWCLTEKNLSVDKIQEPRSEIFYWSVILVSNTLGTALGDFLADDSGLGFMGGAALVGGLLALMVVARYFTQMNRVFLFWMAFVLTRPFGATLGDVLTKSTEKGGLGFGTISSSAVLAGLLIVFVVYATAVEKRLLLRSSGPGTHVSR